MTKETNLFHIDLLNLPIDQLKQYTKEELIQAAKRYKHNGIITRHQLEGAEGNYIDVKTAVNDSWLNELMTVLDIEAVDISMFIAQICYCIDPKDFAKLPGFDSVLAFSVLKRD